MIVISNAVVLTPHLEFPPFSPVIGWQNIVTTGTLAADTEASGFPASNVANPSTAEIWKAADTTKQYLTVTPPGMEPVDYWAVARHNFGSAKIPISIERYDAIEDEWQEIVAPFLLSNDEPLMIRFDANEGAPTRLCMDVGSEPATAAVVYAGKLLILPPHISLGFTPINYGRRTDVSEDVSERGNFLGRPQFSSWRESVMSLVYIDEDWYEANMDAFIEAAQSRPFFVAWNPLHRPRHVGYCWIKAGSNPEPSYQTSTGLLSIELPMRGIAS